MLEAAVALVTLGIWAFGVWSIPKCLASISGNQSGPRNMEDDSRIIVLEEATAVYSEVFPMSEKAVKIDSDDDAILRSTEDTELLPEAELINDSTKVYTNYSRIYEL